MNSRRKFLQLLGLAAPAAALLPKAIEPTPKMLHPTGIPFADPPDPAGVIARPARELRYLGLAQLKVEGTPCPFDDGPEISELAKEAFGRKELYQWPDNDWEDES